MLYNNEEDEEEEEEEKVRQARELASVKPLEEGGWKDACIALKYDDDICVKRR